MQVGDALLDVIFDPGEADAAGLVIDGFPRTALQAQAPTLNCQARVDSLVWHARGMLSMGVARGLKSRGLSHVLVSVQVQRHKSFDSCIVLIINHYVNMSAGGFLEAALRQDDESALEACGHARRVAIPAAVF